MANFKKISSISGFNSFGYDFSMFSFTTEIRQKSNDTFFHQSITTIFDRVCKGRVKNAEARLHYFTLAAKGSPEMGSLNLGPTFFTYCVQRPAKSLFPRLRDSPLSAGGESRNLGKRLKPISVIFLHVFERLLAN